MELTWVAGAVPVTPILLIVMPLTLDVPCSSNTFGLLSALGVSE